MLKDKIILITGSSSGIGTATAKLAKKHGAMPILHGKTESEDLKNLAKELSCEYIFCDVADKIAVESEVQRILKKVKKIDALINCVGTVIDESFLKTTDEEWLDIFKVNVLGTVHFCQAVIPNMLENKYGRIANIASIRGHANTASSTRMAYSSTKGSIVALTASLAKQYAPNILVNAVSPGFTMTPMSKFWTEKGWGQAKNNLLGRVLQPEEIGEALLFLVSNKNTAITGQTIIVDGGYSIFER